MAFKSHAKVFCRYCGRPVPKATTTHYFGHNSGMRLDWVKDHPERPASREEMQRLVNEQVMQIRWHGDGDRRHIYKASTWDGESYINEFFCRNACAEGLGYTAAKFSRIHTQDYRDAVEADIAKNRRRPHPPVGKAG